MKLAIFGAGYSGKAIGTLLTSEGVTVIGTTRSPENRAALQASGIRPYVFDGLTMDEALQSELRDVTHLVQSIAPGRDGDPLLRVLDGNTRSMMPSLEWVGYLSTVGVYGDHNGAWVDETTPCLPVSARSVERMEAEEAWQNILGTIDVPISILRLSGIYGPGRNGFVNLSNGTARRLVKKDQVFNRIRVEDIATATALLARLKHDGIVNVTDDEPAPPQDVVAEAARLMGIAPPPEQPFETAELSPMARSFYGENKRVSNALIKTLGFSFAYPNYRISLSRMWLEKNWNKVA